MNKDFLKVSIIVSNYNGAKLNILEDCLKNFILVDYPNFELLLVDNNSTDNSIQIAKKIFGKNPKFKIIKNTVNMYSKGVNLGFREAIGEYIALFNNDILLKKGYLQKLVAAFKKYPKLAIVQGKLLWARDPSIIDSCGETMDIFGNPVTLGYQSKDEGLFDKEEEVLSATGAACVIKKLALKKVGWYEPDFGIGYEDMDHSLRFRQHGYSIMRIPSAVCFHKRGVTDLSLMVKVKVRWHFNKNRLATMIRNYPFALLIKALPVTIFIYLGNMFWDLIINRNFKLAMTRPLAVFWVIFNFSKLLEARREIRSQTNATTDAKTIKLFSPPDLLGKIKAVILDKLGKIKYSLPWTYPAQIKSLIPSGSTVLDVGCGDGHLMAWINNEGLFEATGVEINKKDLVVASKRKVYKDLIALDLTKDLPFKKKFDVVLCSQVIEHLEKAEALKLIKRIEKLAKKRIIIATINGFFQFDHRIAGKYDIHLSGWSVKEFSRMGYSVYGHGLRFIYMPGTLKDVSPKFLHPWLFLISYLMTPILSLFPAAALLLISYKDLVKDRL